jgi:hypothetical protein
MNACPDYVTVSVQVQAAIGSVNKRTEARHQTLARNPGTGDRPGSDVSRM